MFAETHTRVQEMWGGGETHLVNTCAAKSAPTPNKDSLRGGQMGGVCIGLD